MIINDKEFKQTIKITDFNLAMHIARYNEYQFIDRIIGGIDYDKETKRFNGMTFLINYNPDDEIIWLILNYEFEKFYEKNKEMLWDKFMRQEFQSFVKINMERFESLYFNFNTVKEVEEIK